MTSLVIAGKRYWYAWWSTLILLGVGCVVYGMMIWDDGPLPGPVYWAGLAFVLAAILGTTWVERFYRRIPCADCGHIGKQHYRRDLGAGKTACTETLRFVSAEDNYSSISICACMRFRPSVERVA